MRYAIITDIHANFDALEAVHNDVLALRSEDSEPIDYWFLGDLVGYGPHPVECIRWLKATARIGQRWVPGNHDEWLIVRDKVSADAVASLERHQAILNEPVHRDLGEWFKGEVRAATHVDKVEDEEPRSLVVERFDGITAVFVHASVSPAVHRTTYLYPWDKELLEVDFRWLSKLSGASAGPTVLFCGHTHYPMWVRSTPANGIRMESIKYRQPLELKEGLMIINPGSVGQPRDGDPRAAYLLFDLAAQTVEFRRVDYPVKATAAALNADPAYPDSLAERLEKASGGLNEQQFAEIYKRPQWDLEAM